MNSIQSRGYLPPAINAIKTVDENEASLITGYSASELQAMRKAGTGPGSTQSPFTGEPRYKLTDLHHWLQNRQGGAA